MPLIPDLPTPNDAAPDVAPTHAAPDSPKATQKLAPRRVSGRTTQTWWNRLSQPMSLPHATQLGLCAAGGALSVVAVSLSMGWIIAREPLRDFFGRTGDDATQQMPERVALPPIAPVQTAIEVQAVGQPIQLLRDELVFVEGANEEGTALAELQPLDDDDRRRIENRREDARLLREKRELEDRKRAIERQLEDKQLEEKRRGEDSQLVDGRRDDDRKRIEGWLEEDRRLLEERKLKEKEAIAEAQSEDETQQLAEAQR